jgi:dienelactone hydrolase
MAELKTRESKANRSGKLIKRWVLSFLCVCPVAFAGCTANEAAAPAIVQEEITVTSGDATLAARVSSPGRQGRHPAVVSVHGSGRLGRDHQQFDVDGLVRHGVVVLTYDKRGVGASTGEFVFVGTSTSEAYMPILAADALECLRALRRHPSVDPDRVGFIGISQAGWIIPLAMSTAAPAEVAFAIIRSGPATSVGLEMAYSGITRDRDVSAIPPDEMDRRLAEYTGPHGLDTVPLLDRLRTPTLWLLGEQDASIPIRQTQSNLQRAIERGATITVKTYPGADHSLEIARRPVPYWQDIVDWLRAKRFLG